MLRMPSVKPVMVAAFAAALTGCLFQDSMEGFNGLTMGSTYSIKYVRSGQAPDPEVLQRETEAILADLDQAASTYRNDSVIQRFNDMAPGCLAVPAAVRDLVQAGERLSVESSGALDLTVGPLLELWGFGPHAMAEHLPTPEEIAAARQRTGHQFLSVQGEQLCKSAPVQVDFNSIAAGYAVDRVAERFEALGVTSYLIEMTGELKAKGRKLDGSPWRIAIEAPLEGQRSVQRIVELDGYGVSTSGDYRNFFIQNGKRYSHTLDPVTGAPITHHLASVTVIDPSALRADGLSTVLMILGPEKGLVLAERLGLAALFISRAPDSEVFVTRSTRAFDQLAGGTEP